MRQIVCENCGRDFFSERPEYQRWCCEWCRKEYRAAEQRAARKLWREAGTQELLEDRRWHSHGGRDEDDEAQGAREMTNPHQLQSEHRPPRSQAAVRFRE